MTNNAFARFFRLDVALFIVCIIFFLLFPNLDPQIAGLFYHPETGFYFNQNIIIRAIYWVFAYIHFLYLALFILGIAYYSYRKNLVRRKKLIYLLVCLLLGPGILVNAILKDNSVGRPRPQHLEQFGGNMQYAAPFVYSGECKRNCSFVSGHASIGFYIMALAWIRRRRFWLMSGIMLGGLIGFTRIVQGGHFFSDVVFAGWSVYFVCLTTGYLMHMKAAPVENSTSNI
ncbi:phosphatase PAP2 family protein [Teredinibacter sp. KSP-S5-2]|uniref:phosphatase PAP2 family protein n=1 Tax=Teredinibacter sp. KSP-S5-2 TaxID=3034506 RepID=UPI00293461AA|nr:phosphatase PAP2 family protein [Teredinibacter sp. KSP-S5-2]WNO11204.1 phosphatase PAP2 family protein [Teredinibacter sp. KSP-S5-2]